MLRIKIDNDEIKMGDLLGRPSKLFASSVGSWAPIT